MSRTLSQHVIHLTIQPQVSRSFFVSKYSAEPRHVCEIKHFIYLLNIVRECESVVLNFMTVWVHFIYAYKHLFHVCVYNSVSRLSTHALQMYLLYYYIFSKLILPFIDLTSRLGVFTVSSSNALPLIFII